MDWEPQQFSRQVITIAITGRFRQTRCPGIRDTAGMPTMTGFVIITEATDARADTDSGVAMDTEAIPAGADKNKDYQKVSGECEAKRKSIRPLSDTPIRFGGFAWYI